MASPPPPAFIAPPPPVFFVSWKAFKEDSTVAANLFTLACFVVFTFLIGYDVCHAFKKRATWLPGKAFTLSGVTVQIIVWWTSLSNIRNDYEGDFEDLIRRHGDVVSGRVAVCVFIGYLLPGMAAPSVRVFGALAITICAQIASELVLLYNQDSKEPEIKPEPVSGLVDLGCLKSYNQELKLGFVDLECMKENDSELRTQFVEDSEEEISWSKTADLILLICIIVLGLILCCTVLASKTIRGLLRQRFSAIAEESKFQFSNDQKMAISSITEGVQTSNDKTKPDWNDFEGEVLRSCFVARVCQVDYVISRSVLSSAVWIIVTICVIVFYKSDAYYTFPFICFITMGWFIVSWRWLSAQLYCLPRHSRRRWFCFEDFWSTSHIVEWIEDFWTSHIVEWIDMYDLKRERRLSGLNKSQSLCTRIFTKFRLHKLLYLVLILQVCVVLFCKVFGLLSELTVGEFLYWCRRFVNWCRNYKMKEDVVRSHENYTKILESLGMPGEDRSFLWEANKMSLKKAECLMKKGCKEGSSSEKINSIFRQYSVKWAEDGMKILMMLKENAIPSVLSQFSSVEKHCLKMTVVSLFTIYIRLRKDKADRLTRVMKACHEVWDLVSFADECDIDLQADKINLLDDLNKESDQVCMAANREFYKLQMEYEKAPSESEDNKNVHGFLKDLLEKCENKLKEENILQGNSRSPRYLSDSRNWTKLAPTYALYKLCKLRQADETKDLETWAEESLINVIAWSMSKLPDMIVKQCWRWAQEFEKDKLWEAIQLAGKCRGMREQWEQEPPSQGDQTLSNTEQCTIEVKESPSQGVSTGMH